MTRLKPAIDKLKPMMDMYSKTRANTELLGPEKPCKDSG